MGQGEKTRMSMLVEMLKPFCLVWAEARRERTWQSGYWIGKDRGEIQRKGGSGESVGWREREKGNIEKKTGDELNVRSVLSLCGVGVWACGRVGKGKRGEIG